MARLPHLDPSDLPVQDRVLLARPIGIHRVLANLPEVLRSVAGAGDWIRWHSTMDPRLRELAIVQVGLLSRSVYEYAHHVKIALDFGVTPADLEDLRRLAAGEPTGFGAPELAVLDAATQLTLGTSLADATWERLVELVGQSQASELVATISYYGMVVRLLAAFAVELEPDYEQFLERYPLPELTAKVTAIASAAPGDIDD
jgi:alkylhydroperoxidase family enzyme